MTSRAEFCVRPALTGDVGAIVVMQRLIHAEHVAGDAVRWTTATPPGDVYQTWLGELIVGKTTGVALVAERDGAIVGYAIAEVEAESTKHWSPASLYLHDVFVTEPHRGGGIARQLVAAIVAWREQHRPTLPIRLVTAAHNEIARTFFDKLGFRVAAVELIERDPARSRN